MSVKRSRRKVLVCGAGGFIGRNMVEKLCHRDDLEVYGTYFRKHPSISVLHGKKVSLIKTDLRRKEQVDDVIGGMDIVIQAAAVTIGSKDKVIRPYLEVTDDAVINSLIFRACFENQVRHAVFFTSASVYPGGKAPMKEEDCDYGVADVNFGVGWTKIYIEKMCEFYSRIGTTKYAAIRHAHIYGPHDTFDLEGSNVLAAAIAKISEMENGSITVGGKGSECGDLLYVSDLVDFVEMALDRQQQPFELINVGSGDSIPVHRMVEKLIEISEKNISVEYDASKTAANFHVVLDTKKARTQYGWRPKVSLEDGLRRTLAWYGENVRPSAVRRVVS